MRHRVGELNIATSKSYLFLIHPMRAAVPLSSKSPSSLSSASHRSSQFNLMNRATIHYKAQRCNLLDHDEIRQAGELSVDWLFLEQEAFSRGKSTSVEAHIASDALLPLLKTNDTQMKFAVVGQEGVSGRLALNLGLKLKIRSIVNVSAELSDGQSGSSIESTIQPLLSTPVSFVCAVPSSWVGLQSVSHVFLYNNGMESHDQRKIISYLGKSQSFRLLICVAPLPFQTDLIYIGETRLGPSKIGYLYSTGWDRVPTSTISHIYCRDGVCIVPPNFGERALPPFTSV